jgi:hypothetical protein
MARRRRSLHATGRVTLRRARSLNFSSTFRCPMFFVLQVLSVCLVAVALSLSLAHALELPGKMRLDRNTYTAMQPSYSPGFTIGGGVGEAGGMIVTLILLLVTPRGSREFGWTLAACVLLVAAHLSYWVFTHPVNKVWLKEVQVKGFGRGFFGFDPLNRSGSDDGATDDWQRLRNRWEYSHVVRAALAGIAFVCLVIAVAI